MTELLSRPESQPENTPDASILQEMYDTPAHEQNETNGDTREVSPLGSGLVRAANRMNAILEQRAINKAHGEALKEYRDRDYDGYIGHLANVADSPEATPLAKASAEMAVEREWRREDREKMVNEMTVKVKGFGRSALSRLKSAGLVTLGLSIMGAEATGRGAKKTVEAGSATVDSARETIADYRNSRRQAAERKAEAAATAKYERHAAKVQKKNEKAQVKQERVDARLEAARQRKEAAQARKAERHAKWSSRREAFRQYGSDVKAGIIETKDAAVKGAKFAGNTIKTNAEFAGAAARELTREQKAKLGHLATKARAAGQGAVEGWKSV